MRPLLLVLLLLPGVALAQKVQAKLDCRPAGSELTYDCVIRLSGPPRDQLVLHYRFTQSGATISDHRRRRP
jgi:hypothetical protein